MKSLTLKHFRYFDALAQQLHFGRAAEVCAISQPAMSLQIKELEALLGLVLVERQGRALRLTGMGTVLAARARAIVQSVDEVGDLMRRGADRLAGPLRLGVIPTIAPYLLPAVMAEVGAQFPDLDLHLRETTTARLEEDLRAGRLDAAILALPIAEPSFTEVSLFSEAFVLVRPLAEAEAPVPDVRGLAQMRLLLLEEGHCFRDQALAVCAPGGAAAREVMEGSSLSTLVQMVGAGIGVTLIPEMAVPVEARAAPVAIARFAAPAPRRTIGMIWRKSNPMGQQYLRLSGAVRDAGLAARAGAFPKGP